jgi:hypothetical protein
MKKIIALAVASAFVAPAFAADLTVKGEMEIFFKDTAASSTVQEDSEINFVATEELSNGITVTADILLNTTGKAEADANPQTEGGNSIKFAGAFGSVDLGDTANAVDGVDARSDVGKNATGYAGEAGDASLAWTLPTMVDGLSVTTTWSPKDAPATTDGQGSGYTANTTGLALTYSTGPVSVSVAQVNIGSTQDISYVGGTVTFGSIVASYETTTDSTDGGDELDYTGMSVKYNMGDVTVFAQADEKKTNGAVADDNTSYGIHYGMGPVTFYVESLDDDNVNTTYAGAFYAF